MFVFARFGLLAGVAVFAAATPLSAAESEPFGGVTEHVSVERDGLVVVEAESAVAQTETETRAFYLTTAELTPDVTPDGDPSHADSASGGAYLEILPDTRRSHDDKLVPGVNIQGESGKAAVLHYPIEFSTPGRYFVWVRAYSTNSEDNGIHVGLDGDWPETGARMQWCKGKNSWRWESRQRTKKKHCGVPGLIYLDIEEPGRHVVQFSMREDGFEFDQFLLTTDPEFARPGSALPASPTVPAQEEVIATATDCE